MTNVTLAQQIEAQEQAVRTIDTRRVNMAESILASLRRLQAIEAQKPFGMVTYKVDSDNWPSDIQFTATHSSGADWDNLVSGAKLYALPIPPTAPEGYALVPIEPTRKILDAGIERWEAGYGYTAMYEAMIAVSEIKP